jgi:hypothetical protein
MLRDLGRAFLATVLAVLVLYLVPHPETLPRSIATTIMAPAGIVEEVLYSVVPKGEDRLYIVLMSSLAATFLFWWAIFFIALRVGKSVRAKSTT